MNPENDPTILSGPPNNPFAPSGTLGQQPTYPPPVQQPIYPPPVQQPTPRPQPFEQPPPTPPAVPPPAVPQAPVALPWESPQGAPAAPQPAPEVYTPITVQSPPVPSSPIPAVPGADQTAAPWDALAGEEREIAAPARKKSTREMISVPIADLSGQSVVRVGESRVHGPTTVALPLTLRTGARERDVQLLLELGGPPAKGAQPGASPAGGRTVPLGMFIAVAAAFVVVGIALVATSVF